YDAINWLRARIDEYTIDRIGVNLTWEQATKNRLEIMKHAPKFFTEVFRSEEFYDYATNEAEIVHKYYEQNLRRLTGKELNETEQYLLKLYVEGSVRTTASWLKDDQGKSSSFIVRVLGQALPDFAKKVYFGFYN
ncbi:MAG: TetR/AcrR family transcriptional regulator C-terminal domain-containing protein, partial [Anaerotardibacter sp.]